MEMSLTLRKLKEKFGDKILSMSSWRGDDTVVVGKESLIAVVTFLRDDAELSYNFLVDIAGVDYMTHPKPQPQRFAVAYHFLSMAFKHRVRVKVFASAKDEIPTLTGLWKSADWCEREIFDQYGLRFAGHPNLKRLLNHVEFVGHPLRKDYPIKKRQVLSASDPMMDEMKKRLALKGLVVER
jgi:NADH-quinone oxidoreductase subunit C